jgi:5-methylcytosine-specific restriction endonuclease McrA
MRIVQGPGKWAGLKRTYTWAPGVWSRCEDRRTKRAALPLRAREDPRARPLRDLLYAQAQDEEYFGGLREAVLERDGFRCRVCDASGRDKRSIIVHHRVPGKSLLNLMISLCPCCHSKVHHTKMVISKKPVPPLLLVLWREQHPNGQPVLP